MADVDYFLKVDGIEGDSQDSKHSGEIGLRSFAWAASGGCGTGKCRMQSLLMTMDHGKAAPKLLSALATGDHIKSAVLTCRKAGGGQQDYLKITLSDVVVNKFQHGGSKTNQLPVLDQLGLSFAKIEYEYKEQKSDGTLGGAVKGGWDLKANKPVK